MNQALQVHEAPSHEVAHAITGTLEQLKAIRTFVKAEFDMGGTDRDGKYQPGIDAGKIPGCGDKPTLFLPGAQKAMMYFNCYPTYKIKEMDLGGGHVKIRVRALLISRGSGEQVGEGIGSCSTMESKYRYRKAERLCPSCQQPAIRRSDKEFYCWGKLGGCGAKFNLNHSAITSQPQGQVENPDLPDVHNTVLKMAKKRADVAGAMTLACLSEFFTQDIEDTYTPASVVRAAATEVIDGEKVVHGEVVEPHRPPGPKPENKGLFGKDAVVKTQEFLAWVNAQCSKINGKWGEEWDARVEKWLEDGFSAPDKTPELINAYKFKGHLLKWAKATNRLDGVVEIENARSREAEAYLAAIFHSEKQAIVEEMAEYLKLQRTEVMRPIYKKFPDLAPDQYEAEAEAEHGDTYEEPAQ